MHAIRLDRDVVNVPEIAQRTGRSPESVRLYTLGKRGQAKFPSPIAVLSGGGGVWERDVVAAWFEANAQKVTDAKVIDFETSTWFDALLLGLQPPIVTSMT